MAQALSVQAQAQVPWLALVSVFHCLQCLQVLEKADDLCLRRICHLDLALRACLSRLVMS